ncbi:hypothetical protein [Treponema sp. Marseille-Q4523]|uniref:hypothetical protein n=1 Tax=Treponema sp. Marseille-Q4523 TaxID=2810610 RepID=UPI0019610278|nr:hypothetical protein [Treponema sp. Marseille-Q4523]MBM7022652.1 hypothetical protein [Treponema sp. Marseille-Q4523]
MADFAADWKGFISKGLCAEDYFYEQVYKAFSENTKNGTLPFFNKDLNMIPRELSTGKIINDENLIALEQVASARGYKSNFWIYGNELNKIQKEVGPLNWKRNASPVLCRTKYFDATHLHEQNLYIAEAGSKKKEQYLYNIESLDERSRKIVTKYYATANKANAVYQAENLKLFSANCRQNPKTNSNFINAKDRINNYRSIDGTDFSAVIDSHFKHCLQSATGNILHDNRESVKEHCYAACNELIKKVEQGTYRPYEAGRKIVRALECGTQFQRISVAKNYNLENAKKAEELKVAEANRNKAYRRSYSIER